MWFDKLEKIIILVFALSLMAVIGMRISLDYSEVPSVTEPVSGDVVSVKVSGEVQSPGLYTVQKNSRICDVIYSAGGITNRANVDNMQLDAMVIADTEIVVPSIDDSSLPAAIPKVNINKADTDTLMIIPGIGNYTAQKIVDYRKVKGSFQSIEEIKNVEGIGDKKFEEIKKYIVTEDIKD